MSGSPQQAQSWSKPSAKSSANTKFVGVDYSTSTGSRVALTPIYTCIDAPIARDSLEAA